MTRILVPFLAAVCLLSSAALAQDVSIKAFHGLWKGNALSESNISAHFRVTARDMDVEIRSFGAGGFTVRWATVLRQEGDPNAPSEVLKETQVAFNPVAGRPNVWRAATPEDPMDGRGYYWARLDDSTLSVYSLGVGQDGTAELQIYRRTLVDLGMQLEFTRNVDGESVRTARGKLIKFAQ
ncbi:MAG: hypothetical protein ACMVY4_17625 [Minwuia sp.]|uniref:hypothetical protein n=1 Tax=Minwuia sp. TaxID=2493630 RepID=UPI003A865F65